MARLIGTRGADAGNVQMPTISAATRWRVVALLVVTLALGALLSLWFGTSPLLIWQRVHSMGQGAFVIAAVGWMALVATQTLRWHLIVRATGVRYFDSLVLRIMGNFGNALLPARGGDVMRVELLSRTVGATRATVVGLELTDVWVDKFGWLPALLLVCAFGSPPPWMMRAAPVVAALPIFALTVVVTGHRFAGRWAWMDALVSALARDWKRTALVGLFVAPLPWLLETGVLVLSSRSAGIPLDGMQAFVFLTALNLALIVPTPANLGTTEASGAAVLVAFGLPLETGAAFAVLYHVGQLLPTIALGLGATMLHVRRNVRVGATSG